MKEDRQQIWKDYLKQGGQSHSNVKHMFLGYSRYHEAELIYSQFGHMDFKVLDYGCGTGDYGIYLAREGADVDFWDFPRATKLVEYRLKREGLKGKALSADDNPHPDFKDYDLVIFGEVLEHLDNPYEILQQADVPFIFTSSYPYRSDAPDDPYWSNPNHSKKAFYEMPLCRSLLEDRYSYIKFDGELRLWYKPI